MCADAPDQICRVRYDSTTQTFFVLELNPDGISMYASFQVEHVSQFDVTKNCAIAFADDIQSGKIAQGTVIEQASCYLQKFIKDSVVLPPKIKFTIKDTIKTR
jgi:hypothetical protein